MLNETNLKMCMVEKLVYCIEPGNEMTQFDIVNLACIAHWESVNHQHAKTLRFKRQPAIISASKKVRHWKAAHTMDRKCFSNWNEMRKKGNKVTETFYCSLHYNQFDYFDFLPSLIYSRIVVELRKKLIWLYFWLDFTKWL